jgi:hypothetical protein
MARICVHVGRLLMGEAKPWKSFCRPRGARSNLPGCCCMLLFGRKERAHLSLSHSLDLAARRILFFSNKGKQWAEAHSQSLEDMGCWNSGAAWWRLRLWWHFDFDASLSTRAYSIFLMVHYAHIVWVDRRKWENWILLLNNKSLMKCAS